MDNRQNATINWFPGHMMKAKREMQESMKMVDMVIEIRDSRIPYSSRNPMLDELIQQKPRLIILSKKDRSEPKETQKWVSALSNETTECIALDLLHDNVNTPIITSCQRVMAPKIERMKRKGIRPRAIRAMVVGIPNVGKSTLINRIAKKKVAQTADRPGVTTSLKWIKMNNELELLDTPGVLWPKFEDQKIGLNIALIGSINDQILNLEEVAAYAIEIMNKYYPDCLKDNYGIEEKDPYKVLLELGKLKGFLLKNNEIDYQRTIIFFLNELRDSKLGALTWEHYDETVQ
ncbi:MAG: ribosome biogenesis GTPase YlqF [Erysipelotrichaceae bacterium]|nr:ribosome biogenesis GTPase YlqF [Erysipelotrichaceae bacterium]